MFKADPSRNIGIVLFPAKPSAQDEAATQTEINKLNTQGVDMGAGVESFQNTKTTQCSLRLILMSLSILSS